MEHTQIKIKVQEIFQDVFDDNEIKITEDMTAQDIEDWDSLNHIDIVVATEREFKIKFTTREIRELENIGQFLGLIKNKLD